MQIYADVLVLLNTIINSIILFLTAWISGTSYIVWRLILSAMVGGCYVLGGVLPSISFLYTPLAKLFISIFLILLAFGYRSMRNLWYVLGIFYIVSFILGGAVLGWSQYWQTGITHMNVIRTITGQQLFCGILLGSILIFLITRRIFYRRYCYQLQYQIKIEYEGQSCEVSAMLDTANSLCTILQQTPVIIAEKSAIMSVFNETITVYLNEHDAAMWPVHIHECQDKQWLERVQIIPYRSVGNSSLLVGFRPDRLSIMAGKEIFSVTDVVIAIYDGDLSKDKGYRALLHPQLMRNLKPTEGAILCA